MNAIRGKWFGLAAVLLVCLLSARYVHYSNADLHSVNDGIDYVLLRYGFSF
jgi:hypothetical protein